MCNIFPIKKKKFWNGFSVAANELTPKNKKLLETREKLQKSIDTFHLERKNKKLKRSGKKKKFKKKFN